MFKYFALVFVALFAFAAAEPKPEAKPGVFAYSAPLVASPYGAAYAAPYAAYAAAPYTAAPYAAAPYAAYAAPYAAYSAYPYNAAYVLRK